MAPAPVKSHTSFASQNGPIVLISTLRSNVLGLMTTAQSVSPNVTAGSLLFSIIAFGVMYMILGALLVFLFIREIKKGAEHSDHHDVPVSTDPFSQEVYHGISS